MARFSTFWDLPPCPSSWTIWKPTWSGKLARVNLGRCADGCEEDDASVLFGFMVLENREPVKNDIGGGWRVLSG